MATGHEHEDRIKSFYSFRDEFLNIFKGEISISELKGLTFKEARRLRDVRLASKKRNGSGMEDALRELS